MSWFSRKPIPNHAANRVTCSSGMCRLRSGAATVRASRGYGFPNAATRLASHDIGGAEGALASVVAMPGLESRQYL